MNIFSSKNLILIFCLISLSTVSTCVIKKKNNSEEYMGHWHSVHNPWQSYQTLDISDSVYELNKYNILHFNYQKGKVVHRNNKILLENFYSVTSEGYIKNDTLIIEDLREEYKGPKFKWTKKNKTTSDNISDALSFIPLILKLERSLASES